MQNYIQQVSYRLAIPCTRGVTEAKKGSPGSRPNNSLYAGRKGCPTTQDTEQTLPKHIYLPWEKKIPPLKAIFHLLTSIKGKPRKDCFQVTKLRPRTQPKNIWVNKNKPAPNNIKFTIWILITNFQTWEEENMTQDEEKNKSVGAEWEMTQMIKLVEKSQTPHVLTVTEGSEHNEDTNWCKNISVCF